MTLLALACIAYLLCGLLFVIEELHWFFYCLEELDRQEIERVEHASGITPLREERLSIVIAVYMFGVLLWPLTVLRDDVK
ncbi:hypothetical protein [Lysinibacillus sp. RC79]|uniref:hypothetical protein n=1 Tax=Lysinibacillus sp. RC79 TaxID=3156296 RepID=UPI003519C834